VGSTVPTAHCLYRPGKHDRVVHSRRVFRHCLACFQRCKHIARHLPASMPIVLPILLLLLLSCSSQIVLGAADGHEYTLVSMSSLKPKAWCSGYRGRSRTNKIILYICQSNNQYRHTHTQNDLLHMHASIYIYIYIYIYI
jgi:hypothetical protein